MFYPGPLSGSLLEEQIVTADLPDLIAQTDMVLRNTRDETLSVLAVTQTYYKSTDTEQK